MTNSSILVKNIRIRLKRFSLRPMLTKLKRFSLVMISTT